MHSRPNLFVILFFSFFSGPIFVDETESLSSEKMVWTFSATLSRGKSDTALYGFSRES